MENSHHAVIGPNIFDMVQFEMKWRKEKAGTTVGRAVKLFAASVVILLYKGVVPRMGFASLLSGNNGSLFIQIVRLPLLQVGVVHLILLRWG